MTYTAEGFNQFCYEAAEQFLQTVVVIDNEAVFCEEPCKIVEREGLVGDIINPSNGTLGGQKDFASEKEQEAASLGGANENVVSSAEEPDEMHKNILRAKPLIDTFADKGVICSVIRPDPEEDKVVDRAVAVASVADIVVVDWKLGKKQDESEDLRAKEIIKGIIERDLNKRGRLRLIAVYTAEPNPASILDDLYKHIQGLEYPDAIIKDDGAFTLQNRFFKIAVLLKRAAGNHIPNISPVDFEVLPGRLQELFSDLNRGLLPSVALRSIAAIREDTHHLLAVLNKDLDSALVGHRCLLPHPEDAEEFCEDLVAGEIRSILALEKIGTKYAGKEQNELWIASRHDGKIALPYSEYTITRAQISSLLETGAKGHKGILKTIRKERVDRTEKNEGDPPHIKIHDISQILHGEEVDGKKINYEFARLSSFKREAFGLRKPTSGWQPRLTLGSILQEVDSGKILICLQPRCESVRFEPNEKSRAFPFLEIGKGKKLEFIVVNTVGTDKTEVEKGLYFEPKPKHQVVFEFPKPDKNTVIAQADGELYVFVDNAGTNFYWLGDLKDPFAQYIVGKMSDAVGSVGNNPYEWQRLQCKK